MIVPIFGSYSCLIASMERMFLIDFNFMFCCDFYFFITKKAFNILKHFVKKFSWFVKFALFVFVRTKKEGDYTLFKQSLLCQVFYIYNKSKSFY